LPFHTECGCEHFGSTEALLVDSVTVQAGAERQNRAPIRILGTEFNSLPVAEYPEMSIPQARLAMLNSFEGLRRSDLSLADFEILNRAG
jgi:hypothetical protein